MNEIFLAALTVGIAVGGIVLCLLALDWLDRFFRDKPSVLIVTFILIFALMYIHNL